MNLPQFLTDCENNPDIAYTHRNGFILVTFKTAWSRFPDTRTDKMQDFMNNVKFYKY